jgi:hypothetical protein
MIGLVLQQSDNPSNDPAQPVLLMKLNSTLVSIVKQEWMTSWTNFISDICGMA